MGENKNNGATRKRRGKKGRARYVAPQPGGEKKMGLAGKEENLFLAELAKRKEKKKGEGHMYRAEKRGKKEPEGKETSYLLGIGGKKKKKEFSDVES